MSFLDRLQHGWNAFMNKDPTVNTRDLGISYSYRPDRMRYTNGNERSIINSICNRIAMDVAMVDIKHCRLDENDRFLDTIDSGLNTCLNLEANIDQTGRAFIQDIVMSMLDEGVVAVFPVETKLKKDTVDTYGIETMRTAKILEWYPAHVKLRAYDDRDGRKKEITLPKKNIAIIENPLYSVLNEPNSTMQRLKRKLSLLDVTDEQTASGKLDLIIQLPYIIKNEQRKQQAEQRRKDVETQLATSKYGVAYTDGTEKIVQLNRSLENNLLKEVERLTDELFAQLGLDKTILDGTANEQTMLNYHNRTIEPILSAITDEFTRKFLTKTARTQHQAVMFFRDPFKLIPINNIAEIADKFTRNEIMTSNEIRQIVGMKPSNDPKADQLVNSNISQPNAGMDPNTMGGKIPPEEQQEGTESRVQEGEERSAQEENTSKAAPQDEEIDEEEVRRIMDSLNDEQYAFVESLLEQLNGGQ